MKDMLENRELWLFRLLWLILPLTAGPLFADALADSARPFQLGVSILLWAMWAAIAVASMVPRTQTLTAVRLVAPAAIVATAVAIISLRDQDSLFVTLTLAIVSIGFAAIMAFRPVISDVFVDGSSYGDETRFLLTTPGPLMAGPIQLVWATIVAGSVAGPLLLLSQRWILGVIALILGWLVAWKAIPIVHRLSERWLVFVPAGMVVHDKTALREPQLFRKESIAALGPAPADTELADLSLGALGLALRAQLKDPSQILRNERGENVELTDIDGFIVSPNRPGAVIANAKARGFEIG